MRQHDNNDLEHYLAISRAVAGELDFQNVLNRIAGVIRGKLLVYDHMDVAVVMPTDKSMHVAIETGVETLWSKGGKEQPIATSPIRALLNGEVDLLITGDAWKDPRFHFHRAFAQPIFDANLRSRIHVPMIVHCEVIGALNISSHKRDAYVARDVDVARNIADLIAPYFFALNMGEQARAAALAEGAARGREQSIKLGAQKLTEAMEAERQRLGMELHDQTLADLSSIFRQISVLAQDREPDRRRLTSLAEDISRCTDELRKIIENAKPGVLDLFGLSEAIETQLNRSARRLERSIATSVTDSTGQLLDQAAYGLQLAVFRIVQEAVTNAIRHSGCSTINVSFRMRGGDVLVVVANDGRVPKEGWRRSTGGVDNIRFRASLIGANVLFERGPDGCGSSTTVVVPESVLKREVVEAAEDADDDVLYVVTGAGLSPVPEPSEVGK